MKKYNYLLRSFLNALGVFVYVALISWFIFNNEHFIDNAPTFFAPVFMLLLFVVSALITGLLVLGKPIQLYLDGLKKEGFKLLLITLAWLVLFLILAVIILAMH